MNAPAVTSTVAPPPADRASAQAGWRRGVPWGLAAALAAAAALLILSPTGREPAAPAGRLGPAQAWPHVRQADIAGTVPDGPVYQPLFFTSVRTSIGTAPSPDGSRMRLLLRNADGSIRELRNLPLDSHPQFTAVTAGGDELAWAESSEGGPISMWAMNLRTRAAPRELTTDTGNVLFFHSQYDMVIADGHLYWAAATPGDGQDTQIRSVALTGGSVDVRTEKGAWALTAWPWLVDGVGDRTGATILRNLVTGASTTVTGSGTALTSCSPIWCRVMVLSGGNLVRIDLVHPDGTGRLRIAGGKASAAITDVVPLDRFEILSEPDATSDTYGTQRLLVYDLSRKTTVDLGAGVNAAMFCGGVLWWSTGDQDNLMWHTIDLRTA